jgi:carotenoid cleavage dioxygenase-like enzyme
MAQLFPKDDPYLALGFEPIRSECDCADLVVEGALPASLRGTLYRIGPNPQYAPRGPYNPLLADGMIHAFAIRDGRVAYRNRWVRTEQWRLERAAGRSLFGTLPGGRAAAPEVVGRKTDGAANTNLVRHAGKLLALEEGHAPIAVDAESLETIGAWSFDGDLPSNMTAHPKIDASTGEMIFFANLPAGDLSGTLGLHVADASGRIVRSETIQGPFPSIVHDFAVTRDFVAFFVCPVTISLERLRAGRPVVAWEPERRTHIGLLPRRASGADVRWYTGPACMAWHAMNAFGDDERVHIDVCAQSAPAFPRSDGTQPRPEELQQYLTRFSIVRDRDSFTATRLCDVVCEFPRIDERFTGSHYRYGYVACHGGPGTGDLFHRGVGRFDHATGRMSVHYFGRHQAVSEPVFVPGGRTEGEGHLLTVVYDERRNASHLAVLDADAIEAGPLARAHLDHRVPMGFHGLWV